MYKSLENNMKWILSFFSGDAHIEYLLTQLESATKSINAVRAKIDAEHTRLEAYVSKKRAALELRGKSADRLEKILSALS